jgi:ATP-dependent Clp protease adapter protein ClpS
MTNKQRVLEKYSVVLSNDDHNSMEKVIAALILLAGMKIDEAMKLTLHIHNAGSGIVGTWHLELAETIMANLNEAGLTSVIAKVTK